MKKLVISALCGLCLFGAFVCTSQPTTDTAEKTALSIRRTGIRG